MKDKLLEIRLLIPEYRKSCTTWFDNKSPDTIADALGMAPYLYRESQRNTEKIITGLEIENQRLKRELESRKKPDVNMFDLPEVEAIIESIKLHKQDKNRYPRTLKCLKDYLNDSEWKSAQKHKDKFEEIKKRAKS